MIRPGILRNFAVAVLLCLVIENDGRAEGFENLKNISTDKAENTEMILSLVEGRTGKALRIDHDLREGHYVQFGTSYKVDIDNVGEFRWYLKGNANGTIIEIKLLDTDGSYFGKKIPISGISEDSWKLFTLPKKECHYMWGGDNKIDEIKEIWIALSRGAAHKAYGSGQRCPA